MRGERPKNKYINGNITSYKHDIPNSATYQFILEANTLHLELQGTKHSLKNMTICGWEERSKNKLEGCEE